MNKFTISVGNILRFIGVLGMIPGVIFLIWFNQKLFSNPLKLTATTQDVVSIDRDGKAIFTNEKESVSNTEVKTQKKAATFFDTRNLIQGMYVHTISPDRGIIVYAPILLFSLLGFKSLSSNKKNEVALFMGLIGINLILYSMWGDPWGGWSFGSRYLIPSFAILSIILAFAMEKIFTKNVLLFIFFVVLIYSLMVNSMGTVSGQVIPPKIEAVYMENLYGEQQLYTPKRVYQALNKGLSKSYVKDKILKNKFSAITYFNIVSSLLLLTATYFTYSTRLFYVRRKKNYE